MADGLKLAFAKPTGLKYTDMAIYIDANMDKVIHEGENPEIEGKIFEYMYHIYYALSRKEGYFPNYDDYDGYALYAASQTYITMRDRILYKGE